MSRNLLTTFYSLSTMSLQTLSDIMNNTIIEEHKSNRPEKGEIFPVAFPAPPAPFRAAHFVIHLIRRAVAGRTARLPVRFTKRFWKVLCSGFFFMIILYGFFLLILAINPYFFIILRIFL